MTTPQIDASVFTELSDAMGADFVAELVTTFLDDAANMFAALKTAAADGDADGYRRAAHSIKSNADIFGATILANQAREMELSGLPRDIAPVSELESTYNETAEALRNLLNE